MSRRLTSIEQISHAIATELKKYNEEITKSTKKAVTDVTKEFVKRTKNDARVGRRKGKYKKAISSKTLYENKDKLVKVWYVKGQEYRLAHLLNNGHVKRNGQGFVAGDNHITRNEEIARKELERCIEEVIKNGS